MVILLTLMRYCEHQSNIGAFIVTVKRQIPGFATRNDKLTQTLRKVAADAWMTCQNFKRIKNKVDGFD